MITQNTMTIFITNPSGGRAGATLQTALPTFLEGLIVETERWPLLCKTFQTELVGGEISVL